MQLDKQETAQVLAALRYYQAAGKQALAFARQHEFFSSQRRGPMTASMIDELCRKISGASDPQVLVIVEGGLVSSITSSERVDVALCDWDWVRAGDNAPAQPITWLVADRVGARGFEQARAEVFERYAEVLASLAKGDSHADPKL